MKNKWKIATIAIAVSISAFSHITFSPANSIYAATSDPSTIVAPMSDKIIWRYKTINHIQYKRLYNLTKHKWVGNWIKA